MNRYLLVDFENVGSDGLEGCDKLTREDHIILFYTSNTKKIEIDIVANHGKASFEWQEVPTGKQSADMHIGSYLGFLAGSNPDNESEVIILSKDTDFDKLISYWKARGVKASRIQKLKNEPTRTQAASAKGSNEKAALNNEIMQVLSKANFNADVVGCVASIVSKNIGAKNHKQQIYRAIISKFGQKQGLKIYNHVKKQI